MSEAEYRAAFVERMSLWKPLKASLVRALGEDGAVRWLEKAAEQIKRRKGA